MTDIKIVIECHTDWYLKAAQIAKKYIQDHLSHRKPGREHGIIYAVDGDLEFDVWHSRGMKQITVKQLGEKV